MQCFVATAGWSIPKELRDHCADGSVLQRYAGLLCATELNSTFYRRHRVSTFERWRDSVPAAFRFAVKLPRAITHEAALSSARRELEGFFNDVQGLGEKLGPILVQLPASLHFEPRRAATFFRAARQLHSGPIACEPRHSSWYSAAATKILNEHDVARVVADPARPPAASAPIPSASLLYVRWHGSPHLYHSAYSELRLAELAEAVNRHAARGPAWCIFDNTAAGAALKNALRFRELLDGATFELPAPSVNEDRS